MRIVFISDTHTHRSISVPEGDVLVHAGDATSNGTSNEIEGFLKWFATQPHPHKIFIAGNHDWLFQRWPDESSTMLAEFPSIAYLQDSGIEIDGTHFWGSPWQPWFMDMAFNLPRKGERLRHVWDQIPLDTNVLITHGPPYGILDTVPGKGHLGCEELKIRLAEVKPRIHAFGHIHNSYGVAQSSTTVFINASTCDENYRPVHRPIVAEVSSHSVNILGIEPTPRKKQLETLRAILHVPEKGPIVDRNELVQKAVKGMSHIRKMSVPDLTEEYLLRGLQSDLARLERSENKPKHRPIPFKWLEDSEESNS